MDGWTCVSSPPKRLYWMLKDNFLVLCWCPSHAPSAMLAIPVNLSAALRDFELLLRPLLTGHWVTSQTPAAHPSALTCLPQVINCFFFMILGSLGYMFYKFVFEFYAMHKRHLCCIFF